MIVRRLARRAPLLTALFLAATLACGPGEGERLDRPGDAGVVLAHVAGKAITRDELPLAGDAKPAERRRQLEIAIARALAAGEARRRGLDESLGAEIAAIRRHARVEEEELLRNALFDDVRASLVISERELREHYEQTKFRYHEPQLRLRTARFASRPELERARAEPDSSVFEEIGPLAIPALPQELLPEAARLRQPGQRVEIERDGAWHVIELIERLPAVPQPYEAVRERVEASLRTLRAQQAFRELLVQLRAAGGVEVFESALEDDAAWRNAAGRRGSPPGDASSTPR